MTKIFAENLKKSQQKVTIVFYRYKFEFKTQINGKRLTD